jgi:uncharacterized membrane protein
MRSKVAIAGHPLHPMLVPLPIGLLVGSVLADIAFLASGREQMWYDIAFWALIAGVVTALLAAVAGLGDYLGVAVHTDARRMATAHMLINVAAVVLFVISIGLRLDNGALAAGEFTTAFILSLVAVVGLAVSGWIGGELSFRKHLGVVPDSEEDESREARRHLVH